MGDVHHRQPHGIRELFESLSVLDSDERRSRLEQLDDETRRLLTNLLAADAEHIDALLPLATESLSERSTMWTDPIPGRLGRYNMNGKIGEGGAAVVMLAMDEELSREVAVKLMPSGGHTPMMGQEFELLARLEHPYIARLYDAGTMDGWQYLAMEYMSGGSLADALDSAPSQSFLDRRSLLEAMSCVAKALEFTHTHGITHCDVKPSNILFDRFGTPRLSDFGAALQRSSAVSEGRRYLTPRYAAPEQQAGDPPAPQTDVYALGAVIFEIATGKRPPRLPLGAGSQDAYAEIEAALDAVRAPRATLLRSVCLECLQPDPADRYHTAAAVANDLDAWLELTRAHAEAEQIASPVLRFLRRHMRLAIAVQLIVVMGLVGWLAWPREPTIQVSVTTTMALPARVLWVGLDPVERIETDRAMLGETPLLHARVPAGPGRLVVVSDIGVSEQEYESAEDGEIVWQASLVRVDNDTRPMIEVTPDTLAGIGPFAIDRCEVTNAQFNEYVRSANAAPPKTWPEGKMPAEWSDLPVTGVSFTQASAYAYWRGLRLPSAREWMYAAGGSARLVPWAEVGDASATAPQQVFANVELATASVVLRRGQQVVWRRAAQLTDDLRTEYVTCVSPAAELPAGSLDTSPFGAIHLFGNVAEWTSSPQANGGEIMPGLRQIKGNAWNMEGDALRSIAQGSAASEAGVFLEVGFRCARTLPTQFHGPRD